MKMSIGLIGLGRCGTTLARALTEIGQAPISVADADHGAAEATSQQLSSGTRAMSSAELVAAVDVVLLTVPDAEIARVAASLAWRRGQHVVHCSGALGLEALGSARAAGAACGCLHPLQTFPERFGDPARLSGITFGIEADTGALHAVLQGWCDAFGARALPLQGVERARYHACAVFASNFLVALHAAATQTWAGAGLAPELARAALAPLTLAAADSVARLPLHQALTGPIARGDTSTVASHLDALSGAPDLHALYAQLSKQLLALPLALPEATRDELQALLERAAHQER